nr:MAG TPA: hypothetical protein [Caudoviricetes sp.]
MSNEQSRNICPFFIAQSARGVDRAAGRGVPGFRGGE